MENEMKKPSTRFSAKEQKGFTLIETAIALVVMMVVGLGAASLFLCSSIKLDSP